MPSDGPFLPATLGELEGWLQANGIDTTPWGVGGFKSVGDLWHEVQLGDCLLLTGPVRTVKVAQIVVRRGNKVLREIAQVFADGRQRDRNLPPSEKVRSGESAREAADRCLRDELRLDKHQYEIHKSSSSSEVERKESASYPDLLCEYRYISFFVRANALPDCQFETEEAAQSSHEPVRTHQWDWIYDPK